MHNYCWNKQDILSNIKKKQPLLFSIFFLWSLVMSLYCWYSLFVLSPLLDESIRFIRIFSAITSWQIERGKVEVVTDFFFLGSKITINGDCSHEIRRRLLPGRKAMTNLDSVLKSKDISLLTWVCISQGCGLPSGHQWL